MPQEQENINDKLEQQDSVKFNDFLATVGRSLPEEPRSEAEPKSPVKEGSVKEEPKEEPEEKVKFPEGEVEPPVELKEQEDDEDAFEPLPGSIEQPIVKKEKAARDYSGIADEHKALFEKMGNEAFTFAKQKYIESAKLRQELEEVKKQPKPTVSIYGHERAYVLTPEYGQLVGGLNLATQIHNHWKAQEARMRRGEPWQDAEVKNGKLTYVGEPKQGTAEDEVNIGTWLDEAKEQREAVANAYKQYVGQYETVYKNDSERHNAQMKEFFPYAEAPEMTKMQEEIISKYIVPSHQQHPLAKTVACLVFELAKERRKNGAANKQEKRQEQVKQQSNNPTKKELGAGTGSSNGNGITFSAFKNRMAEAT